MNNNYLEKLIELASKSLETDDVPIGAIIVKNDNIIAEGVNTRQKDQNILGHAEINAILQAQKTINNWNLSDCDLYVTLKPCSMCMEIIKQSRLKTVYYLLDKPSYKKEFYKTEMKEIDNLEIKEMYAKKLSEFFKKMREK